MKMKPLGNRIIVQRDSPMDVSEGGIILPTTVQESMNMGTIVSVGEGHINTRPEGGTYIPLLVKGGDRIIFSKYSNTVLSEPENGDGGTVIIQEADVLCIITEEE